jgi:hypothetical protein
MDMVDACVWGAAQLIGSFIWERASEYVFRWIDDFRSSLRASWVPLQLVRLVMELMEGKERKEKEIVHAR